MTTIEFLVGATLGLTMPTGMVYILCRYQGLLYILSISEVSGYVDFDGWRAHHV